MKPGRRASCVGACRYAAALWSARRERLDAGPLDHSCGGRSTALANRRAGLDSVLAAFAEGQNASRHQPRDRFQDCPRSTSNINRPALRTNFGAVPMSIGDHANAVQHLVTITATHTHRRLRPHVRSLLRAVVPTGHIRNSGTVTSRPPGETRSVKPSELLMGRMRRAMTWSARDGRKSLTRSSDRSGCFGSFHDAQGSSHLVLDLFGFV